MLQKLACCLALGFAFSGSIVANAQEEQIAFSCKNWQNAAAQDSFSGSLKKKEDGNLEIDADFVLPLVEKDRAEIHQKLEHLVVPRIMKTGFSASPLESRFEEIRFVPTPASSLWGSLKFSSDTLGFIKALNQGSAKASLVEVNIVVPSLESGQKTVPIINEGQFRRDVSHVKINLENNDGSFLVLLSLWKCERK